MAADVVPPPPLDVLGAESQGQIGYLIAQALRDEFIARGWRREVAVLLSQTVVDPVDPAFLHPTKFVGPIYVRPIAERLRAERGWSVAADGSGWRRVVASPRPLRIVEAPSVLALLARGVVVVAAGGGGVPVVEDAAGRLRGVEAVVDKDLAAALLAETIEADALLLLTDVDAVYRAFGTDRATPIERLSADEAATLLEAGAFPAGSMGPKVEAAARFAARCGRPAAIGALGSASEVLAGRCGTMIGDEAPAVVRTAPADRRAMTIGRSDRALRHASAAGRRP